MPAEAVYKKRAARRVTIPRIAEGSLETISTSRNGTIDQHIDALKKIEQSANYYLNHADWKKTVDARHITNAVQIAFLYTRSMLRREAAQPQMVAATGLVVNSMFVTIMLNRIGIGEHNYERDGPGAKSLMTLLMGTVNSTLSGRMEIGRIGKRIIYNILANGTRLPGFKTGLDYLPEITRAIGKDGAAGCKELSQTTLKLLELRCGASRERLEATQFSYYTKLLRHLEGAAAG